jgi:hypothetical protein
MNIEKMIEPNANKLLITDDGCYAKILDAELDVIDCLFINDNAVYINTENFEHIVLTLDNLKTLQSLIKKATKYYENNLT